MPEPGDEVRRETSTARSSCRRDETAFFSPVAQLGQAQSPEDSKHRLSSHTCTPLRRCCVAISGLREAQWPSTGGSENHEVVAKPRGNEATHPKLRKTRCSGCVMAAAQGCAAVARFAQGCAPERPGHTRCVAAPSEADAPKPTPRASRLRPKPTRRSLRLVRHGPIRSRRGSVRRLPHRDSAQTRRPRRWAPRRAKRPSKPLLPPSTPGTSRRRRAWRASARTVRTRSTARCHAPHGAHASRGSTSGSPTTTAVHGGSPRGRGVPPPAARPVCAQRRRTPGGGRPSTERPRQPAICSCATSSWRSP